MIAQPFFSICIPVDHVSSHLKVTLESILAQRFRNFEVIIQSNSPKGSFNNVFEEFDDDRILYYENPEPLGVFEGLNAACSRANGRYLKFLLPQDLLAKDCLKILYNIFKDKDYETKLICVKQSKNLNDLETYHMPSDLNIFCLDRSNLFRFLCEDKNWGWNISELCIEYDFFKERSFYNKYFHKRRFSIDILAWFDMVLDAGAVMVDDALVIRNVSTNSDNSQIYHLNEMMDVFCHHSGAYDTFPGFQLGKKRYLSRQLKKQYWSGIKAALSGRGTKHLEQVYCLQKRYGFY